jgi:hypothetical protein
MPTSYKTKEIDADSRLKLVVKIVGWLRVGGFAKLSRLGVWGARPPIGGERTRPQTPFAGGHIVLMFESSGSMGLDLG